MVGAAAFNRIDPFRIERETFVTQAEIHDELPSTNDRALRLAASATAVPRLIAALRQTAGRGRGANRWWASDGALLFSLILNVPPVQPESLPQLSLCMGTAVCEGVAGFVPGGDVRLKWPNDVYLNGRKLCGILIEAPPAAPGRLVVGVGLNVNNSTMTAPADIAARAIALCDCRELPVDMTDVLCALLGEIERQLTDFLHDRPRLAPRWRQRCLLTGRSVTLNSGPRSVTGTCLGIEDDGALLLETIAGPQRFYGGTIETII